MYIDRNSTLGPLISVSPNSGVPRDASFCVEVVGLQMSFRQDKKRSMKRAGGNILLDRLYLPTLIFDAWVHTLDVQQEGGGDRESGQTSYILPGA